MDLEISELSCVNFSVSINQVCSSLIICIYECRTLVIKADVSSILIKQVIVYLSVYLLGYGRPNRKA